MPERKQVLVLFHSLLKLEKYQTILEFLRNKTFEPKFHGLMLLSQKLPVS